mgnify:CR=1 FL=1
MAEIIWTEPALQNLDQIAEYIALDKPAAAKKLVKKVFEVTDRLINFPLSGRQPPELENSIYREIIAGPCRIFYRVEQDKVLIIHIMRSEQLLRKYLLT